MKNLQLHLTIFSTPKKGQEGFREETELIVAEASA